MFLQFFRKISFYLAVGGFISLFLLLKALSKENPMPAPAIAPPQKPEGRSIAAAGIVEAEDENTSIGVPAPGLVVEVLVKVSDLVKKGDVLFRLDERDLRANLITQEAQVLVAQATLKRWQDQLDRLQKIGDARAVSQDEINTRANDVAVARAQLAAATAALAQTKNLLERLEVRSPIDGTILQVNIRAGEYATVSPGKAHVLMGRIDHLQVRADVDEQLAPRIRPGMKAVASVKGDAKHQIQLEFVRIDPFIVPKVSLTGSSSERVDTRVLQVIYRLQPDPNRSIYVGQQMDVFLLEDEAPPAKNLPGAN